MKICCFVLSVIILVFKFPGCQIKKSPARYRMVEIARSEVLWTGMAVSRDGRMFTNHPRWSPNIPFSVGELFQTGDVRPFPDINWNDWHRSTPAANQFVCVQSVYVDDNNDLWVLDSGLSIYHRGIIEKGAKLIRIDLMSNQIVQTVFFDSTVAMKQSYLNDVRVDTESGFAYISDSGLGALIVSDLKTGKSWRVLSDHPSTKSEDIILTVEGQQWLYADGRKPQIHSDGIALDSRKKQLYYQALTGRNLYRIDTKWLHDPALSDIHISPHVMHVGEVGASDGIAFGKDGAVYLTSLEHNAVRRWTRKGQLETVIQDPRLKWPDSIVVMEDGIIYLTTSQLHLGGKHTEPFRMFKIVGE